MSVDEIKEKLYSSDAEVLRLCNSFIEQLLGDDRARGQRAEDKAQEVITLCGAGATIIVGLVGFVFGKFPASLNLPVLLPSIAAMVLLGKSVWFSLATLRPFKLYQANQEFIYDVQGKSEVEALRYCIEVKIWLYDRNVPRNTEKLFFLDRAIRNFAASIFILLLTTPMLLVLIRTGGSRPNCFLILLALIPLIVSVVLDRVAERFSKMWNRTE